MTHPSVEQKLTSVWGVGDGVVEVRLKTDARKLWHDSPFIARMADELLSLADDQEIIHVILNLTGVSFLSVQVLKPLAVIRDTLKTRSGRLIICHLPFAFRKTLRLGGQDTQFEIAKTIDEACVLLMRD